MPEIRAPFLVWFVCCTFFPVSAYAAAPVIGGTVAGQTVDDIDMIQPFTSVTISEPDGQNVTVRVNVDNIDKGFFTAESLVATGFTHWGLGIYFLGSRPASEAQAAIRQLNYDPANNRVAVDATETSTFTITVTDTFSEQDTDNTTTVISTSVNEAPEIVIQSTVFLPTDAISAYPAPNNPAGEDPPKAIDNSKVTKYLNFTELNSGATIETQSSTATRLILTSANDAPERDPASYELYGSDDGTDFTLISAGSVPAFTDRFQTREISFDNDIAYGWYRIIFPTVVNAASANSMQIAEIQLEGVVSSVVDTIDSTQTTFPFLQYTVIDNDGDDVTLTITYNAANGTLSGTGLSGVAGNYTLIGASLTELTNRLRNLEFTPDPDLVATGNSVDTPFTITPNDGTVDGEVEVNATTITVNYTANNAPSGDVSITGTVTENQILSISNTLADTDGLGTFSYQWKRDGINISGATTNTYTLTEADVGALIRVTVSYTDGNGVEEHKTSDAVGPVANVNDAPTGNVTISGGTNEGQMLSVDTSALADDDGLGEFSYQWKRSGSNIAGADKNTYTLTSADVGSTITVTVSYTDGNGTSESRTSAATATVTGNNNAPTGGVSIDGTAADDETLTADTSALSDADGMGTLSYQWKRDGLNIGGATNSTYALTDADIGSTFRVTVSYTDGGGTAESVTSAATSAVVDVNDAPTGGVTIGGTVTEDQTLTANNTLADEDGLGVFSYQWKRNGANIAAATNSTYTLTDADVGETITVTISYTDGGGTAESVSSSATAAVANVNDAPTGGVSIAGTAADNQTLTANNTLADVDGLGTFSYQWKRGGVNISGATNSTYTLTDADVGETITVTISYTDGNGSAESATSAATAAVTDVNDAPTGGVTISGTVTEDETLTANNTLADEDGLGAFSYQWKRGGANIGGATGNTYMLTDADVGETISVTVGYTDGGGTAESVTSAATAAVTNVNDEPTGSVTISGTVTEDQTLTANNTLADSDGLGAFSYQWKRSGANIGGANSSTYTLGDDDVGETISVTVSYTDGEGTAENVTSGATAAVVNVDDNPTGSVTISGTAAEDDTLTANNTLADADGLGALNYQWKRGGTNIGGATGGTYTLGDDDVGETITVTISYTDGNGSTESITSAATAAVANANDDPTGSVTISGTVTEDQTLTANNTLADSDGLGTLGYQWKRGGGNIAAATNSTYTLTDADVGEIITVTISYTDGNGTAESVISTATTAVANVNDDPTGGVTILGVVTEDQTLTANNTLSDADNLGAFSYQWKRGGSNIGGATGSTYTLGDADVGETIAVTISYTDGGGTEESVTSSATAAVANVNDSPTGSVTISGTATEDQTLTANNTLADADGLGAFSYQWKRGGANVVGAINSTYTLGDADAGETITVTISYTDGGGTAESVTSAATAAVANINDNPTGGVTISGTATEDQTLTANNTLADPDGLGVFSYQWKRGGANIAGATNSTYTLTDADVGETITVTISYTDGGGATESTTSTATAAVANVNDDPTGSVTIGGTVAEDETLTANSTLADADGLGAFSYQWKRGGANIAGATGSTYTLTDADVGETLTATISYTDGNGTAESVTSDPTAAVTNTNDNPTGSVTISGTATEDQTLTANNTLADADGLGAFSYQWKRGGANISGATNSTYTLTDADVGETITVTISYTDDGGTAESITSTATAAVTNVNDDPTGGLAISGTAAEDETLTADNTLADNDGLGAFGYQWKRGGVNITGATGNTYTLTDADVGETITVTVSYTDGNGTAESVTSGASAAVANVNDAPTGGVTISGTATEDQTLTANNTLADSDGLGAFSYQWKRSGANIGGATSGIYTLTDADVGEAITVTISYNDGNGTLESVSSAATAAVANVNDAPTGTVSIAGTVADNQTLTANNTLADADGLGAFSHQWKRGGVNIGGATNSTYTLTDADVGEAITVTISYTDGNGTAESVTSGATAAVADVNDAPTGSVTISGTVAEDETLAANNTLIDEDGLGTFSYQWKRGGVNIGGATNSTYTLTDADVGETIAVTVSYTDGGGTLESVTSAVTAVVTNVNDAPTGGVAIGGTAAEDQTLTANNTLADADGIGTLNYQWKRGGANVGGATGNTYTLTDTDVGETITVTISYTDGGGNLESVTSAATGAVVNVNDAPTGGVTISGTATEDQTLTANNTLADADGLGVFSYQWKRGGANIGGATNSTYTLTDADVGETITLTVSYIDGNGAAESVTSVATAAVANVNDAPTGTVSISGTVADNQTLTANNTLADTDGLGTLSYQWKRNGANIAGAAGSTYTLTDADVGATITVTVSYTDGGGAAESITSGATAAVADVNDAPAGGVTISGTVNEDQTLTANNTLADEDGLGIFNYQWKRGGVDIAGATNSTYTLIDADVGETIAVTVSYTDGSGTVESVTSAATAAVANVNDAPTGGVTISGTATEDQTLTANDTLADVDGLGAFSYQWKRGGVNIAGATNGTYTLTDADVGETITVTVSYTDGGGTAESAASAATAAVVNVNDDPAGSVTISGTVAEDQTLTANNTLADADGLGTFSYQWERSSVNIAGATGNTYTLTDADVGETMTVTISYTDDYGTAESMTSAVTAAVSNVNDAPSGGVTISGTATEDQTLTANNSLADSDGLGVLGYQWKRGGANISGANGNTYMLSDADVGEAITVTISYTDDGGTAESITSTATAAVVNVNDAPTGGVAISGTVSEDQTLTVNSTLVDADGLGAFSYQWKRGGTNIGGATNSTYTLTDADVGGTITVTVSYTDGNGTVESATSSATAAIANVNDAPIGTVSIAGTVADNQTLTANNTLVDADGLGALSYQWKRNGANISGATGSTYTLTDADVGEAITVTISYTDDGGTAESISSTATAAVADVNDAPTGTVTVSGTVAEDETLTANNTLADEDGLGAFSYQWKRGGVNIAGATGSTYTLTDDDVGEAVTVTISYTDGSGMLESVTSAETATVTNANDAPGGSVTISGTVTEDQILTASNTLTDADGLGALSYQWKRNGVNIAGATGNTYTLTDADVGETVTVTISYSDGNGTAESVTSAATAAVTNVNDAPTGGITLSGTAAEDQILSVNSTLVDDDGLGTFSYQWQRGGVDIAGATGSTYTLSDDDVGATISVTVSYTDDNGTAESFASSATSAAINVNDDPAGGISIDGVATKGQTLIVNTGALSDDDGLGAFSYQWQRDGVDVAGATGNSYTLGNDDVDAAITVTVNYTDGHGTAETVTSAATAAIADADLPPVVTAPADLAIDAEGLYTRVDPGTATVTDTEDASVSATHDAGEFLPPGRHTVTWTATDSGGNTGTAAQILDIRPLADFGVDQTVGEGATVTISVHLNGDAPEYPVTIPYTVSGSATAGVDFALADGTVTVNTGTRATITLNVANDGPGGEPPETVVVTMDTPINAAVGVHSVHTMTIVEDNRAPHVELDAMQGMLLANLVSINGDDVMVTAVVTDSNPADSHSYDWSLTDNSLVDIDTSDDTFTFDPSGLTPGLYIVRVRVTDNGAVPAGASAELKLKVVPIPPVLPGNRDNDNDGVTDDADGHGDEDNDGVENYRDAINALNVMAHESSAQNRYLLESEAGLHVRLGAVALAAGQGNALVTLDEIENFSDSQQPVDDHPHVGGLFDFEINGLPRAGESVKIVLPQRQAVPAEAKYRKLMEQGWQDFVEDARNALASAPGYDGYCPPPGAAAYTAGLTEGHWCVQLTIEDGGPNDADGGVDGRVVDPGGVVTPAPEDDAGGNDVNIEMSGGGGGGSFNPLMLGLFWLIAGLRARRRMPFAVLMLLLAAMAVTTSASAENSWSAGVDFLSVSGSSSSEDFNEELVNLNLNVSTLEYDTGRSGYRVHGGYRFGDTPHEIRVGYTDLGEVSVRVQGSTDDVDRLIANLDRLNPVTASGLEAVYVYRHALTPKVDLTGSVGVFIWKTDYDLNTASRSAGVEVDGTDAVFGFSIEFPAYRNLKGRAGFDRYAVDSENISVFSLGVAYKF